MPSDSSADLLFRISADSTQAQGDLAALRGAVSGTFGSMVAESHAAAGVLLYDWAGNPIKMATDSIETMGGSSRGAREALRGLGEEMGVRMPRFVSGWLTSLGPVAGIMSAAFAPIAVIGLIEVIEKIPGALQKGIDWLHGWTAEAKKAFEETTKDALEFQTRAIRLNERLRAIALIGVDGMQKWHLESVINSEDIHAVASKIDELNAKVVELKKTAGIKAADFVEPVKSAAEQLAGMDLTGQMGPKMKAQQLGPSHEEIEKAKIQLKELEPVIKELTAQLDDLTVKSKELPAQAGAAAAKLAAEWKASIEKQTEALAAAAQHRIIEELKTQREEEDNATKHREKLEEESEKVAGTEQQRIIKSLKRQRDGEEALREQLAREDAATLEGKEAAVNAEIALERDKYAEEGKLSTTAETLLEQLRQARLAKLRAESGAAYAQQMAALGEHLQQIERAEDTSRQRIEGQYAADVAKFSAAEEKKELHAANSDAERTKIAVKYAAIRSALYRKEQEDLRELQNSTGWRGVLGHDFKEMIQGNEDLLDKWEFHVKGSMLMIRMALEGVKEEGEHAFASLAQGMAGNIAQAVVHSESIKKAMQSELESVLENLSAQAIT